MSGGRDTGRDELWRNLRRRVREGLLRASAVSASEGIPGTDGAGQLIRPLVALAGLSRMEAPPEGFWEGVLAIQLAHEASLIHDDIVDAATERRGSSTLTSEGGVARALVHGDHLLAAAYRAAVRTGSLEFVTLFARAVERTVAGEATQERAAGMVLDRDRYEEIALGKAGELLGCALAVAPVLERRSDAGDLFELGRRLGLHYQMLDDLLDYCPLAETGKTPLGDYVQGRWTWLLEELPGVPFGLEIEEVLDILHSTSGGSAIHRSLARLEHDGEQLRAAVAERLPDDVVIGAMIADWVGQARQAVAREAMRRLRPGSGPVTDATGDAGWIRGRVPALTGAADYMALNSRSFRFASRFFPPADAQRVVRVYAFCRITDDLADQPPEGQPAEELLEGWLALSRRAYQGDATGLDLLDRVMEEMADARVPFHYVDSLVEGMRMDLRGERFASLPELRLYTYRVASVVGLWLTRLFGVNDPAILERAERMGHAMQLTNILRDVGEDWRRGRLYLPGELLRKHGMESAELAQMCMGGPLSPGYRALIEELMGMAEADYRAALAALPMLAPSFARPVAVAAHVYRGIHREIRRRGYDNLRYRAHTTPLSKGALAARALWELHRARHPAHVDALATAVSGGAGE